MPTNPTPELLAAWDAEHTAIREATKQIQLAATTIDDLRQQMDSFEEHLRTVLRCRYHADLDRLVHRLRRVRELHNAMEIGSLSVEASRKLDEARRRMP
jgi:Tfp pilus assembly protein PilO